LETARSQTPLDSNTKALTIASLSTRLFCIFLALALFTVQSPGKTNRLILSPKLRAGQKFSYLVRYRSDKQAKTQSNVAAPMAPTSAQSDTNDLLEIEILETQPAGPRAVVHAKAHFRSENAPEAEEKSIEFTILANGRVENITGFDMLSLEQQQSWLEWISLFAVAESFPEQGVKLGEKWKTDEQEKAASPIAGLEWQKETSYVKDEPCSAARLAIGDLTVESNQPQETCAVFLTKSELRQKSSSKDATPEDYRLHELRTMGTASGTNETIAYISLKTGMVVRATEEAAQFMDVAIAKTDGSNRVHYNIDAKSHTEVLLIADASPQRL
jgi:hypothetical protein